jgi:gamma-glutamylcyclotransferase (GGCT)/AIG2-like uncharacterized protein YtfP
VPARARGLALRPAGDSNIVPPQVRTLFAYGTLADERFVAALLERPVGATAAELLDFVAFEPPELGAPIVLASAGARVAGKLYRNLSEEELARLDAYEGVGEELYLRDLARAVRPGATAADSEPVWVYLPTGRTVSRYVP